jgi:hypothetical protein
MGLAPSTPSFSNGNTSVNPILGETNALIGSMQVTALQNDQAQKAREAQEAQKAQKRALEQHLTALALSQMNANAVSSASLPKPPQAFALPFTTGSSTLPASTPPMPAVSSNPVDAIKSMVSNAWTQASQLIASGVQGVGQFVTAIPSQVGQFATNTVQRVGQFITGDKSTAVAQAAKSLEGSSSREGPGGGNVACAWKTAKALRAAGYDIKPGSPEEVNVNAQIAFLKKRGAVQVPQSEARPGDIVYSYDRHIGIVSEGQGSQARVISNSSSKAQFCWKSDLNFDGYYKQNSQIWRLPTTA